MQWKSRPPRHLFLLVILTTGIGCISRSTAPQLSSKALEGIVLKVACPGEPAAAIVGRYGKLWTAEGGAGIEVVHYDPAAGPEAGQPADLWIMPPAELPHWAAAGKLNEVPADYTAGDAPYAWGSLLGLYRYKLLVWDQKNYGLPLLGDATLCFYRTDLLEDSQHQTGFRKKYGRELTAPETWEQFAEIAEYFNQQGRPGIARVCSSLPPLPTHDEELDREFYLVAAPFARLAVREDDRSPPSATEMFSFHYDLETGAARINAPGFVHALELLQRLQAYRPAAASAQPPVHFEKGEAILCLAGPAWIGRFQQNPLLRGKFGICQAPGSDHVFDYKTGQKQSTARGNHVPYLGAGGWVAVVPRKSAQPEAAFALAAWLSDPKTSRDIVIEPAWGGGIFRRDHLEGRVGWQAFDLDAKGREALLQTLRESLVHPQMKNPVLRLRIPDERAQREALDIELRAALVGGKDARQALDAAAQRWRTLHSGKDGKTRLAEYQLSLSLGRDL